MSDSEKTDPLARITFDPEVCGGWPCIHDLRTRVTDILETLAGGTGESIIL